MAALAPLWRRHRRGDCVGAPRARQLEGTHAAPASNTAPGSKLPLYRASASRVLDPVYRARPTRRRSEDRGFGMRRDAAVTVTPCLTTSPSSSCSCNSWSQVTSSFARVRVQVDNPCVPVPRVSGLGLINKDVAYGEPPDHLWSGRWPISMNDF